MREFPHQFKERLLTPGPTAIPYSVREAMALPMIHHRKNEFKEILEQTQIYLKDLFATKQNVLILASSGTGAMVASVTNLFNPNDEVIIIEAGKFGERFVEIAQNYKLITQVLKVEWSKAVDLAVLENYILKHKNAKAVFMQACETSTGAMQDVEGVAKLCQKYDKLLVVDGISQVGIAPCAMDKWGIDCLLTGSQKGLLCPPGLAFIALSEKAKAQSKKVINKDYYFNLEAEENNIIKNQTHFTTPVSLIQGLNAGLATIFASGLDNLYAKQFALREATRAGLKELGLKSFVADENAAWGLTSVLLPDNCKAGNILNEIKAKFNLVMASGQDDYKDKMIRIGHMGYVDIADIIIALNALAMTLENKLQKNTNYLNKALEAYYSNL